LKVCWAFQFKWTDFPGSSAKLSFAGLGQMDSLFIETLGLDCFKSGVGGGDADDYIFAVSQTKPSRANRAGKSLSTKAGAAPRREKKWRRSLIDFEPIGTFPVRCVAQQFLPVFRFGVRFHHEECICTLPTDPRWHLRASSAPIPTEDS
jgi:hypothetical protein